MGLNHVSMIFSDSLTPKIGRVMWGDLGVNPMFLNGTLGSPLEMVIYMALRGGQNGKIGKMSKNVGDVLGIVQNVF